MSDVGKTEPRCTLCGEPMPEGEEMFKFHGYSGNCPKPPLAKSQQSPDSYVIAIYEGQPPLRVGGTFVVTEIEHSDNRKMLARVRACTDLTSQDERLRSAVVEAAQAEYLARCAYFKEWPHNGSGERLMNEWNKASAIRENAVIALNAFEVSHAIGQKDGK